jgi:ABC-type antimicrobial peptide transport system ATPase subunit
MQIIMSIVIQIITKHYADYDSRSQDIRIVRQEPRVGGSVAVRIGGRN